MLLIGLKLPRLVDNVHCKLTNWTVVIVIRFLWGLICLLML